MSLYKEYIPLRFDDSILHKTIIKRLKNLKTIVGSIILYGPNGCGKYILSRMILENSLGMDIYNQRETVITYGKKSFMVYSSNYHYEIYLKDSYIKSSELEDFLEKIGQNRSIVHNKQKIVIVKNSEHLSIETIFVIKKLIEKQKLSFILLTNQLTSRFLDISSLFMCIRVPLVEMNELVQFVKFIKKKDKIKIVVKDIKEIIIQNKLNISRILYNLKIYSITGSIEYKDILNKKLDIILDLVYRKNIYDITKIRKLLYDLGSHNINRYEILKYCFTKTVSKLNTTKKQIELLEFTYEINNKLSHSFRTIIHIEYYLIKLMDFIE